MTDYGTDVDWGGDLDPGFGLVSGTLVLAQALARRLRTERGSLWSDEHYGVDITDFLNCKATPQKVFELESMCANECRKDERVETCEATAIMMRDSIDLTLAIEPSTGAPFTLTLTVGQALTQITVWE